MSKRCINCGQELTRNRGAWVCPKCNTEELAISRLFGETDDSEHYLYIECPGATVYKDGTTEVIAGVKWLDENDPSKGYLIIDHPVYAANHTRRRRIKADAYGRIRRCAACQDLTVRLRRPEGPDFCVPSHKHPHRTKLKPASFRTFE